MKMYANLHTHSTHSDGGYTPAQIARVAKEEGYGAIAITDHDTATGFPELKAECDKIGMETIFGAEFTAPSKMLEELKMTFHIVGFHFDPEYPAMKEYLAIRGESQTNQTKVLFERGLKLGLIKDIEWDEVLEYNKGVAWLCNNHLFRVLLAKGLLTSADHGWYFREMFGKHKKEVPPLHPFKQEHEIIQLIRDAGGIALLAHPKDQLQFVEPLMEMGIEGLEVWNYYLPQRQEAQAIRMAYDKGLYISGGSDHYGRCDGYYGNNPLLSGAYIPELSAGTYKLFFEEIRDRKLYR